MINEYVFMLYFYFFTDAYDSSSYGELDRHFHHRFEVAGRVQILGEDVDDDEDEDAVREGDQVIVLPFPGQQIG